MKKVMLIVGHDSHSKGCCNEKLNVHEFDFCMNVATELFKREEWEDIDLVLKARNYSYKNLPSEVNDWNPDYVIELHLNAVDNKDVQGTEHLYCSGSKRGKEMASIFQKHCLNVFGYKNRGLNETVNGENGYHLLRYTKVPCVIAEPFFLSDKKITKEDLPELTEKYIKYLTKSIREVCNLSV